MGSEMTTGGQSSSCQHGFQLLNLGLRFLFDLKLLNGTLVLTNPYQDVPLKISSSLYRGHCNCHIFSTFSRPSVTNIHTNMKTSDKP